MNRDVCEHFVPSDLHCDHCADKSNTPSLKTMNSDEALRLADALDGSFPEAFASSAAAELRRLHEAHDWQYRMAGERLRRIEKLEAQRDALLEALKSTGLFLHHCWCDVQMNDYSFEKLNQQMQIVDAAIKAAEENT